MLMMASTGHRNYWLDRVAEIELESLFVRRAIRSSNGTRCVFGVMSTFFCTAKNLDLKPR